MTEKEIYEWLVCFGEDPDVQLKGVRNLLAHANGDDMSPSDRVACQQAIALLQSKKASPVSTPPSRPVKPIYPNIDHDEHPTEELDEDGAGTDVFDKADPIDISEWPLGW